MGERVGGRSGYPEQDGIDPSINPEFKLRRLKNSEDNFTDVQTRLIIVHVSTKSLNSQKTFLMNEILFSFSSSLF